MRWVPQEDAEGCAVATVAMLTDRPYADVRAEINTQDHHGHDGDWSSNGVSHVTVDRLLIEHGYFMQTRYRAWQPDDWPPRPWAPVHYANVKQPSGNGHFVVMDARGRVLDPLRKGWFALTDWPDVHNVVGLVWIGEKPSAAKTCVCGCKASLEGKRETARFASEACARRDRRRREKAGDRKVRELKWVPGYWRRKPRSSRATASRPSGQA